MSKCIAGARIIVLLGIEAHERLSKLLNSYTYFSGPRYCATIVIPPSFKFLGRLFLLSPSLYSLTASVIPFFIPSISKTPLSYYDT